MCASVYVSCNFPSNSVLSRESPSSFSPTSLPRPQLSNNPTSRAPPSTVCIVLFFIPGASQWPVQTALPHSTHVDPEVRGPGGDGGCTQVTAIGLWPDMGLSLIHI